ncbi:hypothetical protein GCM10010413_08630 [Promicromonospora sukumoe]|uniref:Uncharacterized protein n=1 Tax=Promicromonospora sukumoe TaxID=88382 RepID=A0A7W3PCJ5_9MICO|nr:hypothetical protein [Promicromonospora sukumoe]MBA8806534.1 hypothetical protein [Promicromonospora sukumoe]
MSRLSGHTWRTTIRTTTLDGRSYRVVRPSKPVSTASLHENALGPQLSVHQDAARDLVAAWWLAARSPHSLIHLPLRTSGHVDGETGARPLDLVLLHHSLGFRPADWKTIRARTGTGGSAHTVELPEQLFPTLTREHYDAAHHREHLDDLHWTIAADTLFVTGSRAAFELDGPQLRDLVEKSPAFLATRPDGHRCAELSLGTWRFQRRNRNPFTYLHVQLCETHR